MKMRKMTFLSLFFVSLGLQAQDLQQARQAVDAEQYQKAKTILKSMINSDADKGENYYYLADVYLTLKETDSAKIYLNKGLQAKDNAHFNYIGLGQIALDQNNIQQATENFNKALEKIKRRDTEELIGVGRAYINSENKNPQKAIEFLTRAIQADSKSAQAYLALGDAHQADKNVNDAYRAYRDALALDKDLKRAKLRMAVITKNAKAFQEAANSFNEMASAAPSYGPVYRELAETYYYWGVNEPAKYKEYTTKALEYYKKYMSLTDYSLNSRMRYADFLILTEDYTTLEAEANKMKNEDKINPRIYRYLGYAAYENKNYQESVEALTSFFEKGTQFISRDYLFLAKAKLALAKKDGEITDMAQFEEALAELEKAVEKDPSAGGEFSTLGEELYKEKLYDAAAKVFVLSTQDTLSKSFAIDNYYLGNAVLFSYSNKLSEKSESEEEFTEEEKTANLYWLEKADIAFGHVVEAAPTTHDAVLNWAKINRFMDTEEAVAKAVTLYEDYIRIVEEKGEEVLSQARTQRELLASHTFLGSQYSQTDKTKAIEHFQKALTYNPNEGMQQYITESIDVLRQ
ncbi:MAG: tetratricopeptide repeat protein [Flavobacteriaceae bacterium]